MMKKERVFWGVFLILAAVIMICGKMDILPDFGMFKITIGILLVASFVHCIMHRSLSGLLFTIAFLCILFSKELGLEKITPFPVLLAAVLLSIGLEFLFPKKTKYIETNYEYQNHHSTEWTVDDNVNDGESDHIEYATTFGAGVKYISSSNFKSARLKASFGGMKVYFDNALIPDGLATVQLDVKFSGVELYIPKGWKIVNDARCAFGAIDEKNPNRYDENGPTLRFVGEVSFAGVEIIYV